MKCLIRTSRIKEYSILIILLVISYSNSLTPQWPLSASPRPISNYSKIFTNVPINYSIYSLTGNDSSIPDSVRQSQFNSDDLKGN